MHVKFNTLFFCILTFIGFLSAAGRDSILSDTSREVIPPQKKTQVLVLGSAHLSTIAKGLRVEYLESLLDSLEKFKPDFIGVEAMPPYLIGVLAARGGYFREVLEQFAAQKLKFGQEAQKILDLDRSQAEEKGAALMKSLREKPAEVSLRSELIMHLLAAYDLESALLQWIYLAEDPQRKNDHPPLPDGIRQFLAGQSSEKNEIVTIGVRLAHRLGLQQIHGIDDHQDKDDFLKIAPRLIKEIKDHPAYRAVLSSPFYADSQKRLEQALDKGDLLPYYLYINSVDYLSEDIKTQWHLFLKTGLASGLDRSRLALWEVRNLNIASHIRRLTALKPGGKILVIIGVSHKPFLDAYLGQMMDIRTVQLDSLDLKN